jgi:hypothetical protein
VLEPGSSAGVLVYENVWAAPFATAMRRSGGQLVASGRIPVQAILAARRSRRRGRAGQLMSTTATREGRVMPGLIRGVARTAAIAGTATAVSNRVSRRQAGRWAAQEEQQQQAAPSRSTPRRRPAAAPPADMDAKLAQLKDLAELRDAGVLTGAEFEQQKNKILSS